MHENHVHWSPVFLDETLMSRDAFVSPGRLVISNGGHIHESSRIEFSVMQYLVSFEGAFGRKKTCF